MSIRLPFEVAPAPIEAGEERPCPEYGGRIHARNHLCVFVGRNEAMFAEEWRCKCGFSTFANSDESRARREVTP